ncbi:hypothetical protein MRX96_016687 [Rhipicephalus microplus]
MFSSLERLVLPRDHKLSQSPQFSMVAYASRVDATRSSGVCIYVRDGIAAGELPNVAVPKGEACAVQLDESVLIIEAVYESPNNSLKDTTHVVATPIPSRAASELCVVAGDFNRAPYYPCVPLKDTFNLDLASVPTSQTTQLGSTIDLVYHRKTDNSKYRVGAIETAACHFTDHQAIFVAIEKLPGR